MIKLLIFFVLIGALVATLVLGVTKYLRIEDSLEKADAIVAVSGGDTEARTRKAVALHQQGYAPLLVFSGAARDPRSPSNAQVMKELALASGVAPSVISIDELSRDTKENAVGVSRILKGSDKVILVTSEYHQRRAAKELAQELPGVEIINAPAEDANWNTKTWWLTPYGWWVATGELIKNAL